MDRYNVLIRPSSSPEDNLQSDGVLYTENICFTGKLERVSRSKAQEIARQNGAVVQNSLSKNTTILVYGEKSGSKLKKAQAMGIQLWTEDQFFEKIEVDP